MARILFIATLLSYCSLCLALPFDSTYEDEVATHKPTLPIPSAPDYVVEALARSETAAAASKVLPVFWENVQPPTPTYRMTNSFTVPRPTCGGNSFGELLCFIVTYASIAAVCVLALMPFFILAYTIFHQGKRQINT
jgi:hypothetical protein